MIGSLHNSGCRGGWPTTRTDSMRAAAAARAILKISLHVTDLSFLMPTKTIIWVPIPFLVISELLAALATMLCQPRCHEKLSAKMQPRLVLCITGMNHSILSPIVTKRAFEIFKTLKTLPKTKQAISATQMEPSTISWQTSTERKISSTPSWRISRKSSKHWACHHRSKLFTSSTNWTLLFLGTTITMASTMTGNNSTTRTRRISIIRWTSTRFQLPASSRITLNSSRNVMQATKTRSVAARWEMLTPIPPH